MQSSARRNQSSHRARRVCASASTFQARGLELAALARAGRARGSARARAVVLSTCNRARAVRRPATTCAAARADLVHVRRRVPRRRRRRRSSRTSTTSSDLDAARHLFRVAAGLDSLVVGEPQILGQVKEAHSAASDAQTVGPAAQPPVPLLVRRRQARAHGNRRSASGAVSVSYAAVALARKIFGDLDGRSVVVIGAGEMGKLTAQHMKSQGVQQVTIVSRTMAHAARTAEAIGGATAAPWDEMDAALGASDIVITATGAASPILTKAHDRGGRCGRGATARCSSSTSRCRATSKPAAGEIEQVFLYNIDDLQATVRENLARRASEVARAEAIVDEEARQVRRLAPVARRDSDRRRAASAVRGHPPRRARAARLQAVRAAAADEARARVDEITHLIVEKLLLTPTEQLKSLGDRRNRRRLRRSDHAAVRPRGPTRGSARRTAATASRAVRGRSPAVERASAEPGAEHTRELATRHARQPARAMAGQRGRGAHRGRAADRPAASSSSRHRAIGCRTRRCRKSAASGCSSRKSKTRCSATRSTSRSTAARTCRPSCPRAWPSPACCRARIRSTRSCCRSARPIGCRRRLDRRLGLARSARRRRSARAACAGSRS